MVMETLGQSSGLSQWYVVRNVPGLHAPWSIIIQPLVPSRTSRTSQSEILTVSRNLSTNMLLLTVGSIGYPEVSLAVSKLVLPSIYFLKQTVNDLRWCWLLSFAREVAIAIFGSCFRAQHRIEIAQRP